MLNIKKEMCAKVKYGKAIYVESLFSQVKLHSRVLTLGVDCLKGIVQPFELKGVTRLIRSAVKNWRSEIFLKAF
jgi:hypothetical protein